MSADYLNNYDSRMIDSEAELLRKNDYPYTIASILKYNRLIHYYLFFFRFGACCENSNRVGRY